jgi:hypothetical protein
MSERVLRSQVEQFRHRKSRDKDGIKRKNLFSNRLEVFSRAYRCEPSNDKATPLCGAGVLLLPDSSLSYPSLKVVLGVTQIGRITGESIHSLLEVLGEVGGWIDATVSQVNSLSGSFEVRLDIDTTP